MVQKVQKKGSKKKEQGSKLEARFKKNM